MAFVYVEKGTRVDLTEQIVLAGLYRSYNASAGGQGDVVMKCKEVFDDSEKTRVQFHKLYKYYNDEQEDIFVKDVLRPLFGYDVNGNSNYDKMCRESMKPPVRIANYTKRFVDKLATLYDESPTREIEGDEEATKTYNELAQKIKLDSVMQMAERYQKLFRSAFVRPVIRKDEAGEDALDLDVLLPTVIYAIPFDQDQTRASAYFWLVYDPKHPDDAMKATWYYIDRENYFWWTWETAGAAIPTEGTKYSAYINELYNKPTEDYEEKGEPEGNNLGETGIVRLATDWVTGEIIPCPGDSMLNFQDNINLIETMMQGSLIFQGYPILHLKNFDNKDANGRTKQFSVSPWTVFTSSSMAGDNEADVSWVAPAANIEQFKAAADHAIDVFLLSQGIPKNLIMDSATSGTALAERNRDIKEIRKSYINQYIAVEQELYRVIAKWTANWLPEYKLPEEGVLRVEFKEPGIKYISEMEELLAWEKKISMGIATVEDYFIDNGASPDEAKEKAAEANKANGAKASVYAGLRANVPNAVDKVMGKEIKEEPPIAGRTDKG